MWSWDTGVKWPNWLKLGLCIAMDVFDFSVGRAMLGIGTIGDVFSGLFAGFLWGRIGFLAILEVLDPTEQIDGFIPSNTALGIAAWVAHSGKKKEAPPSVPAAPNP
jgi:hypothetical protein